MRRQDVHIPDPCHADWHEMDGDNQRRFCDSCSKHVHDLSAMTRVDAEAFMAANQDTHVCVQYLIDADDQLIFRDDAAPEWKMYWQRDGISRLIAAAALALPLSLAAACDSPQAPVQPSVDAPIVIKDGQAPRLNTTSPAQPHTAADPVTQPGAGRAPTFQTTPPADPPTPAPDTNTRIERGEVEAMPDHQLEKGKVKKDPEESCDQGEDRKEGHNDQAEHHEAETPVKNTRPLKGKPKVRKLAGEPVPAIETTPAVKPPVRKLAGKPMPSPHLMKGGL